MWNCLCKLWTRRSFPPHLAEFNGEGCHRLTAAVEVVRPVYCRCSERTGLSALIMDSVLIVCLWDNGAAEKPISKCSDFHQRGCQTSPFVYTWFSSEALQSWKVLRRHMAAVCPLHGGQTQILQCENTTKICKMKISPPKQTEAHLKVCLVAVQELLIRSQDISTSFLPWND